MFNLPEDSTLDFFGTLILLTFEPAFNISFLYSLPSKIYVTL